MSFSVQDVKNVFVLFKNIFSQPVPKEKLIKEGDEKYIFF
jgi:hypothetical protein